MRKSTKLISALLVLVMVFSLLPISALAAEPDRKEVVEALSGALADVLKNEIIKIGQKADTVIETGNAAGGFFGSIASFLKNIGAGSEAYYGTFRAPDAVYEELGLKPDEDGVSITIAKTAEGPAEATIVKDGAEPIYGTAVMEKGVANLVFTVNTEEGDPTIKATLAKDGIAYTLTITEVSGNYWGWVFFSEAGEPIENMVIPVVRDVNIEEATENFGGIVVSGAKIVNNISSLVEGIGVKGKLFGVFEGIAGFGSAYKTRLAYDYYYQLGDYQLQVYDKHLTHKAILVDKDGNELLTFAIVNGALSIGEDTYATIGEGGQLTITETITVGEEPPVVVAAAEETYSKLEPPAQPTVAGFFESLLNW